MPIDAPTPTNVPASEAKVYDKYWLKSFNIMAGDPERKVTVQAVLQKARMLEDGSFELSPYDDPITIRVNDFYAAAESDPSMSAIKEGLLEKIKEIAIAQNKI